MRREPAARMADGAEHDRVPATATARTPARRCCYTRAEMEALRLPDSEFQRRWWTSVYRSLDPAVAREYEGLCDPVPAKHRRGEGLKKTARWKTQEPDGLLSISLTPMEDGEKMTNAFEPCQVVECDNFGDEFEPIITDKSLNEESSDDDYNSIQRPAFFVQGEPNFESGPPEDGLEYLRRVRWEAVQLPRVKVVKYEREKCQEQTSYMPKIPDIPKCPENLLPSKEWVDIFLSDFASLRHTFSQIEHSEKAATQNSSAASEAHRLNDLPMVSGLLTMTPVTRAAMLQRRVIELENESFLSRSACLWIFALCIAVDAPLNADMCAIMRSLLRKCATILASRSDPRDDEVVMLNILIVISGNYFGQSEKHSQKD